MTPRPLVSVVIIFRDGEPYLEEAIASVFAQTYPAWELLLVDDGSTDGSTHCARACAAAHPSRVRYLEHEGHQNRGMSASRNLGITEARGEFLAFLDADDMWVSTKLEQQMHVLVQRPELGMIYGATLYWYSWMGPGDHPRDFVQPHRIPADTAYAPPSLVPLYLSGGAAVPSTGSLLARTNVVRDVGGFDETFRGLYEDQVFYAKICLRYPVFVAAACWDRYRQHPRSTTARAGLQTQLAARSKYLTWLAGHLDQHGIDDRATRRTIRLEQWLTTRPRLARMIDRARRRLQRWRVTGP